MGGDTALTSEAGRTGTPLPRKASISILVGMVTGIALALGHALYSSEGGNIAFSSVRLWATAAVIGVVVAVLGFLALTLLDRLEARSHSRTWPLSERIRSLRPGMRWLAFLLVISLSWIPAFLALYPGYFGCDGPLQLNCLMNYGFISLQWPTAHTLLLYVCVGGGNLLLGSYDAGVTLYCVVQAGLLASTMAYASSYLIERGAPVSAVIALTAITMLNPVVQTYAFVTATDSMFGVFLLLSVVLVTRLLGLGGERAPRGLLVATALALTGLCLFRSQGVYIVIVVMILAALILRKNARCLLGCSTTAILLMLAFNLVVGLAFTTQADAPYNSLNLQSQQIARVWVYDRDSLTDEQVGQVERYYDTDKLEGYLPYLSDPAKTSLRTDAYLEDKAGLTSLWLDLAKGHEGLYAEAFLWDWIGYLYPSAAVENPRSGLTPWNEFGFQFEGSDSGNVITQDSLLPAYYEWLYDGCQHMFRGNILLTLWVSIATPGYVLIASFMLLARRRRMPFLIPWLVPFVFWGTLTLSPICSIRYVVPLFYCVPFLLLAPWIARDSHEVAAHTQPARHIRAR